MVVLHGSRTHSILPEFVSCGECEVGLGPPCGDQVECGDFNGDGSINISDSVCLINYIFAGGPAPCAKCL